MAMMRARVGMRERRPLLGEEERRRPQHETTNTATTTTTTTLRLRRRWPFSSSNTTTTATSASAAATQSSRVTESTVATATNSSRSGATTTAWAKTQRRNISSSNNNITKSATKSHRATPQKSLSANYGGRVDPPERYAPAASAPAIFKQSSSTQKQSQQRKTTRSDGLVQQEDYFLQPDAPAVSYSVSSTSSTTTSSFANLHINNSHSTSASSALSFSNNNNNTGFLSQANSSTSSSGTNSNSSNNMQQEDFAVASWDDDDDSASHDSTQKTQKHHQHHHDPENKEEGGRYTAGGGYRQDQHHEEKKTEDPFFENTNNNNSSRGAGGGSHASHATASTLTADDHQQQQQQRRSLDSGGGGTSSSSAAAITSTTHSSSSPAPSSASTALSSSVATPSPGGQVYDDDDDLDTFDDSSPGGHHGLLSAAAALQKRGYSSNNNNSQHRPNPVKAVLSRPLGRHTLPVAIARKWVVEVSSAEWDADEQRWKYRILVQSRRQQRNQQQNNLNNNNSSFDEQQLIHAKSSGDSMNNDDYNSLQSSSHPPPVKQARSFTAAFTWRSLADFLWLEQALRMEFHGSLLLPILSIALGKPADENLEGMPVESDKLRDWLSDALNGIRGQGEWILPNANQHNNNNNSSTPLLLHSESMEAFLYRNCGPLQEEHIPIFPAPLLPLCKNPLTPTSHVAPSAADAQSIRDGDGASAAGKANNIGVDYSPPKQQQYRSRATQEQQSQQQQQSLVQQFFHRPLDFLPLGELCAGPVPDQHSTPRSYSQQHHQQHQDYNSYTTPSHRSVQSHSNSTTRTTPLRRRLPVEMFNCSSRALSSAPSLEVMDSFAADSSVAASPRYSSNLAIHSEVVEAERDLVLNYRATAISVMEKMKGLQESEENIGLAWKRLAISISNLFAYEKDVEHAKLGELKRTRKENMPYRKVAKKTVDECLRVMARQKVERAVPSLRALQAMLSAYVADLSAVEPSVEIYTETVRHLSLLLDDDDDIDNITERYLGDDIGLGNKPVTSWDRAKEAMRALVEKERAAKNHLVDAAIEEEDVATLAQRKAYQQRILHHERALCNALTTMCRATPMRVARMSWCYWNTEATQCAALHSAAHALRTKISIANKDSVSRMLKRHLKEEKEDHVAELALLQRMINLGNNHKFAQQSRQATDSTSSVDGDSQVEITNDELGEQQEKAMLRDQALLLARQRIGRWDSKLGLAIMRAIGIEDPNVRVEETTRDLRLIRKYVIGLRECLSRCIDAVERIRAVILNGGGVEKDDEDDDDDDDDDDDSISQEPKRHIREVRKSYLTEMARLFSGQFIDRDGRSAPKSSMPSMSLLTKAGIDMSDPFGWSSVFNPDRQGTRRRLTQGRVGDLALAYSESRDQQTEWLLTSLSELLHDYYNRVETVEGYVYMECVGIQLEKHFSEKRTKALSAFEKKTDITTAINIATRKCMPQIVKELQAKLDLLGPDVSHTLVKETKEVHFESKSIKADIHALAVRRLTRARETSTERAIALMSIWAKEEESMAATELKSLGEAMSALERLVAQEDMGTTGRFA